MKEVLFIRMAVQGAEDITYSLREYADEGWEVTSHADDGGEYSFVLHRLGRRLAPPTGNGA